MIHDLCIVGCGTAGTTALHKILKSGKNLKVLVIDMGRSPGKRRHSLYGFLGTFAGSDGKLFTNNLTHVSNIAGYTKTMHANNWVMEQWGNIAPLKLIKDKRPMMSAEKRLKKQGFELELNNYYQLYPKDIHSYSKVVASEIDKNNNTICSFDNEVYKIFKHKNHFSIVTSEGDFQAKKILVSVGRGGWRWAADLFANFGIVENNDVTRFGIRVEISDTYMKDWNHSNCTLTQNLIEVGPLSWHGTSQPEDHLDLAITTWRSNESRWATDKVSFNLIAEKYYQDQGVQQLERIGKLAFILGNDRIMKERLSGLMNKKSKISVLTEFDWLPGALAELNEVMPELLSRGVFYAPCLLPFPPTIKLDKNFASEVDNMYVVGEAASIPGILGSAVSGCIAADAMMKGI